MPGLGLGPKEQILAQGWAWRTAEPRRSQLVQDLAAEAFDAAVRISEAIKQTPVQRSQWLSRAAGCDVRLKLDNEQVTGSFKVRGASNKVPCIWFWR